MLASWLPQEPSFYGVSSIAMALETGFLAPLNSVSALNPNFLTAPTSMTQVPL